MCADEHSRVYVGRWLCAVPSPYHTTALLRWQHIAKRVQRNVVSAHTVHVRIRARVYMCVVCVSHLARDSMRVLAGCTVAKGHCHIQPVRTDWFSSRRRNDKRSSEFPKQHNTQNSGRRYCGVSIRRKFISFFMRHNGQKKKEHSEMFWGEETKHVFIDAMPWAKLNIFYFSCELSWWTNSNFFGLVCLFSNLVLFCCDRFGSTIFVVPRVFSDDSQTDETNRKRGWSKSIPQKVRVFSTTKHTKYCCCHIYKNISIYIQYFVLRFHANFRCSIFIAMCD